MPFDALTPSGVNSKPIRIARQAGRRRLVGERAGVLAVDADEQDVGLVGLDLRQHLREVLAADGHQLVQAVELVAGVGDLLQDVLLDDAVGRLADVPADEADGLGVGVGLLQVLEQSGHRVVRRDRPGAPEVGLALAEDARAAAAVEREHLVLGGAGEHRAEVVDVRGELGAGRPSSSSSVIAARRPPHRPTCGRCRCS